MAEMLCDISDYEGAETKEAVEEIAKDSCTSIKTSQEQPGRRRLAV